MKRMRGVNTAISTPLSADGNIDYQSLQNLCDFLIEKGVNGLYPNGSTGEMAYFSLEERKHVLESVIEVSRGRADVFAMVGANNTRDTIELAQHAQKAGADGIGVVTPYYYRLTDEELLQFYKDVSRSVSNDFSIYLYGIPQFAVNDITAELAGRIISECPNVVGIKYSYPDMPRLLDFMTLKQGDFSVIAGVDNLFFATLASGGDGVISGHSNIIPELYVAIYKAYQAGDYELAAKIQKKTNLIATYIANSQSMSKYKVILKHRGIIKDSFMRKPLMEISEYDSDKMIEMLEHLNYTEVPL